MATTPEDASCSTARSTRSSGTCWRRTQPAPRSTNAVAASVADVEPALDDLARAPNRARRIAFVISEGENCDDRPGAVVLPSRPPHTHHSACTIASPRASPVKQKNAERKGLHGAQQRHLFLSMHSVPLEVGEARPRAHQVVIALEKREAPVETERFGSRLERGSSTHFNRAGLRVGRSTRHLPGSPS